MEPGQTGSHLGYRPALDGIRGVAILAVIGYHAGLPGLKGGALGVDLFFVLSGFLITCLLLEEWDASRAISLRKFYLRRALRLLPALLVLLVACALYAAAAWPHPTAVVTLFQIPFALFYGLNWLQMWFQSSAGLLAHTWSLSIEEQFYLLWPLALCALLRLGFSRRMLLASTLALAALAAAHRAELWGAGPAAQQMYRVYLGLDTRADALLIGAAMAALAPARWSLSPAARGGLRAVGLAAWVGVAALVVTSTEREGFLYSGGLTLVAAAAAAIVVQSIVAPGPWSAAILESRALVGLGRISYGLYLWHYPVLKLLQARFPHSSPVIVGLAGIGLTLLVALASFRIVEAPFLRQKARTQASPEGARSPLGQPAAAALKLGAGHELGQARPLY